jgi:hypothetical protein
MKKLFSILLLSASLSAESLSYLKLGVGYDSFNTNGSSIISGQEFTIGYGFDKTFRNSFYAGFNVYVDYSNLDHDFSIDYGSDIDLGLRITPRIAIYGIGSVLQQGFNHAIKGGEGFGYGIGLNNRFSDVISGVLEYKEYNLVSTVVGEQDYVFESIVGGVNIRF